MPQLEGGKYYEAVVVPEKCGFFRKRKNDGSQGQLYLRVQLRCVDGDEFPYPYYVSGQMAERLRDDLPKMGVSSGALQDRAFYKDAGKYIQPVECSFGTKEEEFNGEWRTKIKGVYFNPPKAADESDVDVLMRALGGVGGVVDPFGINTGITDDDWNERR